MKKTLIHFIAITLIILIVTFLLEHIYSYTFRNGIPRNKRQELLIHKDDKFDILFLGSSRTESHINDSIFEKITGLKVINAGMERATIHDSFAILHKMLKNNNHFKECWIQLDYTLNIGKHSGNMFAEIVPFLNDDVLKLHALDINQISSYEIPFQLFMKNDKAIGFREFFLKLINKESINDISLKFKPLDGQGTGVKGKWPNKIQPNIGLKKMIDLADKKGVEIHFFSSPNCPEEINRAVFAKKMKKFYKYDDYFEVFDDSLQYFRDCGHLNKKGAIAFTRLLANDYIKQ